ncbi:MAG TPA: hypothetical protein VHQ41_02335 [Patescibacteria group bacterium]|jgi:protein-L-isoaspartate O-methyltransferase|nr:hypothetical protein [Patescibacteria group bacterium]
MQDEPKNEEREYTTAERLSMAMGRGPRTAFHEEQLRDDITRAIAVDIECGGSIENWPTVDELFEKYNK